MPNKGRFVVGNLVTIVGGDSLQHTALSVVSCLFQYLFSSYSR